MQIILEIPDRIGESLHQKWGNISHKMLEILVAESYKNGTINKDEVRQLLGLPSRSKVDIFLKNQGIYMDYTEDEIDSDILNIKEVRSKHDRCL